jgi:hypothetical protein
MNAKWLVLAVAAGLAAGAFGFTAPTEADLTAAAGEPAKISALLKDGDGAQYADAVNKVLASILASSAPDEAKREKIVALIGHAVQAAGDQAPAMMALVAKSTPAQFVPLIAAVAVVAGGFSSPVILTAMIESAGDNEALVQSLREAGRNPGAYIRPREFSFIPLTIRQTVMTPRFTPLPVGTVSLPPTQVAAGPKPPAPAPRYRGQ